MRRRPFLKRVRKALELLASVISFLKAIVDFFDRDDHHEEPKDPDR